MISSVTVRIVAGSIAVYLGVAGVLVAFGTASLPDTEAESLAFDELRLDYAALPKLQGFNARDGTELSYRSYPADSELVLVLLHGSGWHSRYLYPLANHLSDNGIAQVVTPDLRGHGERPKRRGDIDYQDQLEDDLADLLAELRRRQPQARIVVGGHSSGGGLAIRFAGSQYGNQVDGYLLLAPFLRYDAPTVRPNSGGWARPFTPRIIGLSMFERVGIDRFSHLPAIAFDMPKPYRDGTETLTYSYRLMMGFAPRHYRQDLAAISQPTLLLIGSEDEAFVAEQFKPTVEPLLEADIRVLPGLSHMGVVVSEDVRSVVETWLGQLPPP
ncbi:alpha/beta hydrolase [Ferrimonas futtsuensis]|uniref:alpha/beta hydrolase n=1 Tax=Ferrimonas futtsuensis TaxID=364764 RepID=UPI000684EE48|nr:alpha/beta hydrolase [Ferrimonas futtsuensis]